MSMKRKMKREKSIEHFKHKKWVKYMAQKYTNKTGIFIRNKGKNNA